MKKNIFNLLVIVLTIFLFQACKEEPVNLTQTINGTIRKNATFTFTLPENNTDNAFEITEQASHAKVSMLYTGAGGSVTYSYTPETNFIGTDQIIIDNAKESGHKKGGKCNGGNNTESITTLIVSITVNDSNTK